MTQVSKSNDNVDKFINSIIETIPHKLIVKAVDAVFDKGKQKIVRKQVDEVMGLQPDIDDMNCDERQPCYKRRKMAYDTFDDDSQIVEQNLINVPIGLLKLRPERKSEDSRLVNLRKMWLEVLIWVFHKN